MIKLLYVVYLLGVPLLLMNLSRYYTWINKIAPMTLLYIIGLAVANFTPFIEWCDATELNTTIGNLAVPFSIPLMLLGCNLRKWSGGHIIKTFLTGLISVLIVTIGGFFIFKGDMDNTEFAQICAVITGQYTGGIPNVGPIAKSVGISEQNLIYLTSCDLIITGIYLIFIIFCGKKFFHWVLPAPQKTTSIGENEKVNYTEENSQIFPFDRKHWKQSLMVIGITTVIVAISYICAKGDDGVNMTILMLLLTTLSIGASFIKPLHKQESSFDMGLYCVYVFCLSIASACDFSTMNLANCLNILGYVTLAIFFSLVLQILFAKIFKIDGDSVLVCSIALINSPPFVPMVAAVLNNRDVMITGISIGILGYMLGNYLGIGTFWLLTSLC